MPKAKKKDPAIDLLGDAPVQITLTLPAKQASAVLLMLAGVMEESDTPDLTPAGVGTPAVPSAIPVGVPAAQPPQMPQVAPLPVATGWPAQQPSSPSAPQTPVNQNVSVFPVAPAPAPAPAPQQAPAYAPAYQPGYPPTAAQQYTLEQLAQAAAPLADRGMQKELSDMLARYGVVALTELNPVYYPAIAGDLRALGARI